MYFSFKIVQIPNKVQLLGPERSKFRDGIATFKLQASNNRLAGRPANALIPRQLAPSKGMCAASRSHWAQRSSSPDDLSLASLSFCFSFSLSVHWRGPANGSGSGKCVSASTLFSRGPANGTARALALLFSLACLVCRRLSTSSSPQTKGPSEN